MRDITADVYTGTPAHETVKILILQYQANILEALEALGRIQAQGIEGDDCYLRSRIITLYLFIKSMYERRRKERLIIGIDQIETAKLQELKKYVIELNSFVDELEVTKIDTRKKYDRSRTALEDEEKGI